MAIRAFVYALVSMCVRVYVCILCKYMYEHQYVNAILHRSICMNIFDGRIKDTKLSLIVTIHGAVLCLLGDTPGSNFLGGFKEGVGFSLRKCRRCLVTKEVMNQKVSIPSSQYTS